MKLKEFGVRHLTRPSAREIPEKPRLCEGRISILR